MGSYSKKDLFRSFVDEIFRYSIFLKLIGPNGGKICFLFIQGIS
jgi:hypothetical protein